MLPRPSTVPSFRSNLFPLRCLSRQKVRQSQEGCFVVKGSKAFAIRSAQNVRKCSWNLQNAPRRPGSKKPSEQHVWSKRPRKHYDKRKKDQRRRPNQCTKRPEMTRIPGSCLVCCLFAVYIVIWATPSSGQHRSHPNSTARSSSMSLSIPEGSSEIKLFDEATSSRGIPTSSF